MSANRFVSILARRTRPAAERPGSPAPRRPSLWNQPPFRSLWLAATVSDFGFHVMALALPLTAAVTLGASPFQMGLLTAVESLPYVILGLFAGVLVDRLPRKPLLILSDWIRAGLLAVIPILAIAGHLSFTVLLAVGLGVGTCTLIFNVAQVSLMPAIIQRDDLADANGRLEASAASAQATGPGIAGVLIGALNPPLAIAVNAATFAISGLILRRIPATDDRRNRHPDARSWPGHPTPREPERRVVHDTLGEVADGLRVLWREPVLRSALLGSTIINLFGYVFLAVYIIFMARTLGLSNLTIGLILSAGGVGAVTGAIVSPSLRRRIGFGPAMVWSMAVCCVASVLVPLAFVFPGVAIPLIAIAEMVQYGALAIFNIGGRTLRQVYAADAYQGRVNATARTLMSLGTLVGSLAGGLLGSWLGLGQTLVIGSFGMMLALVPVVLSPLPRLHRIAIPAGTPDLHSTSAESNDRSTTTPSSP